MRVLGVALGTVDQIRADSVQTAQELITSLKQIHGKINDARLGFIERTKV
jgi:hypothetical protein